MSDYVAGGRSERLVPRTTEARNAREVSELVHRRLGPTVSIWGMAMVVASEATLFGCFFGTYYYLRFQAAHWPPLPSERPEVVISLVMVAVLTSSSLPMQLAVHAARAGRVWATRWLLALALLIGAGYFGYELKDFTDQLHRFDATTNAYGSIYVLLLGADHAHVFVALLLVLWLLWKLVRGLTMYRLNAVQAIAFFWHAVVLLTWCVIGTLLSAAL